MAQAAKRNKLMNRSRVLRAVWRQPHVSRSEVAAALGLDKSTVSVLVSELIEAGVLQEVAEGSASKQGGRRPIMLRINSGYGNVLGLEVQPDYYRAVLCDLEGHVLGSVSEELGRNGREFDDHVSEIISRVDGALGIRGRPVVGIGIALGGLVDSMRGIIYGSIPMEITQAYDFGQRIASKLPVPAYVENDANACALGELTFHRSTDVTDFLYVLVQIRRRGFGNHPYGGIGVGVGIVTNGALYSGRNSTSGEFRSVFCTDSSVGQLTLTDEEASHISTDRDVRLRLFREVATNTALIVNVLNLGHVFFGGDIMSYADEFREVLAEEIDRLWPYGGSVDCVIHPSTFGENAVAYGAAGMLLDRLFTDQVFPVGHVRDRDGHARIITELNEAMVQFGGDSN